MKCDTNFYSNTEYRNYRRINVHAHLPIVLGFSRRHLDCRDVIKNVGNFDHRSNLT